MSRALGIDLGTKRIGVAVSSGTLATPYEVVVRSGDRSRDHARIAELAVETGAEVVVVGMPLSLDGTMGPAARAAEAEIAELADTLEVPVAAYDERLTTVTADRQLMGQNLGAGARRQVVDKVAASVMLQAWLDAGPPSEGDRP
ncbi:MAG: Holliday junction resolvase RuvX [Acidimicrobiales bacterium]|nr:Holliday junction resolvase RuvX [Acidimicrobiales bacterium]